MIRPLERNGRTFYQAVHTQAIFLVIARVSHMDDGMADGELEVLVDVQVEDNYIHILDSLNFPRLIVWTHSLGPAESP